jgi:hypothetical protein
VRVARLNSHSTTQIKQLRATIGKVCDLLHKPRQAAAEREKRATITKAEGDRLAAENLAAAASTMTASPGAMQLRTLQTIDGLGPSASNTVVVAVPIEIMELVKRINESIPGNGRIAALGRG